MPCTTGTSTWPGPTRARATPTATARAMATEDPDKDGLTEHGRSRTRGDAPAQGRHRRATAYPTAPRSDAGTNPKSAVEPPGPAAEPGRRADPARRPGLSRLPGRQRLEHADRRPRRGLELGDDDLDDRADRGLHMDFGSYAGYGIPYNVVGGDDARARRSRSTTTTSPTTSATRSRRAPRSRAARTATSSWSTRTVPPLRAVRRAQGRRRVARRQRRDLGPALERPAARRLDQRRCRRPADPAGPRPLRRGRRRRDRPRAAVHDEPRRGPAYIYPARHEAGESSSSSLPPMGLRVRLKASYDTSRLLPAGAGHRRSRSSATG